MAHPNEVRLQELYAAFAKGDLPAVLGMCADSIQFRVPGSSPAAGTYTKGTFMDLVGKVMQMSGGTFSEEAHTVVANDHHGAVLLTHRFRRGDVPVEYRTVHIWEIRDGLFTGFTEWPGDQGAFDKAWS